MTSYGFLPLNGSKARSIGFEKETSPSLRSGMVLIGVLIVRHEKRSNNADRKKIL